MIGWTLAIIGGVAIAGVLLAIVELRKITPLAFRCRRCNAEFRRRPYRAFPARCPACGADDWSQGGQPGAPVG